MATQNKKSVRKARRTWKGQVLLIAGILLGVIFLPTTLVLCIGMLPTPMAALADRTRQRSKVIGVGAMNLAGCTPFIVNLWMTGNDFEQAVGIVTDPKAIIVMYSAAALGYLINWAMTGIVSSFLFEKGKSRQKAILKRQQELIERWGREVTGEVKLDERGFAASGPEARAKDQG